MHAQHLFGNVQQCAATNCVLYAFGVADSRIDLYARHEVNLLVVAKTLPTETAAVTFRSVSVSILAAKGLR